MTKSGRSSNRVRKSRMAEAPGEPPVPTELQPQDRTIGMQELAKQKQALADHIQTHHLQMEQASQPGGFDSAGSSQDAQPMDIDNDGPSQWEDLPVNETFIRTAMADLARSPWRRRMAPKKKKASWTTRKTREHESWERHLPNLVEAFLEYSNKSSSESVSAAAAPSNPSPSLAQDNDWREPMSSSSNDDDDDGDDDNDDDDNDNGTTTTGDENAAPRVWTVSVLDIFTLRKRFMTTRDNKSLSPTIDLLRHGYVAKTPKNPQIAVHVKTLELLYTLRQYKASYSIEAFAKVVCKFYAIPYRRFIRDVFADTFELYVRMTRIVEARVHTALGWDEPDWRIKNACRACCYTLEDEPPLEISRIICLDGNNSLKRMKPVNDRVAADTRTLENSDYFLSHEYVDKFSGEVKGRRKKGPEVGMPVDGDEKEGSDTDGDEPTDNAEGDPTDGVSNGGNAAGDQSSTAVDGKPCTKNWKAAQSDEVKRMWDMFNESGIFASACRHGMVLVLTDMVRSGELAKYPIAVMDKLLKTQKPKGMFAYDIGCNFSETLKNTTLGPLFIDSEGRFCVPAFHGYSHNYICQLVFHPNILKGMGIEDAETLERVFSGSNALAIVTRFASAYRRRLMIETYFKHADEEKYQNSGRFILDNYAQALDIVEKDELAVKAALSSLKLTEDDLVTMAEEEREFFQHLEDEEPYNVHEIAYVETLLEYYEAERTRHQTQTRFFAVSADDPSAADYQEMLRVGRKIETERRTINERVSRLAAELNALEVILEIPQGQRWTPAHPKFQESLTTLNEKSYRKAVDNLQRLVILRLFELHRLNVSRTGYKMRSHIAKSLKTRSQAIRRAVTAYNTAARKLGRSSLDWSEISKYSFIEEFDLLKNTRNDIRTKRWVEPAVRETIKKHRRIERAKEEIIRCNVEARRLHTAIRDEERLFQGVILHMSPTNPLYSAVVKFCDHRRLVNQCIMVDLENLYALSGFTGVKEPGVREGSASRPFACSTLGVGTQPMFITPLESRSRRGPPIPADEESDEEAEAADEANEANVEAVANWLGQVNVFGDDM